MALALAAEGKRQYAPAWRWIAENYLVRDGDTGKPVPFVMFPWIARILLDVLPEQAEHLPYSLCMWATIKKCVAPQTRVLTADLQWVPAGDLLIGQKLLAFDENPRGKHDGKQVRIGGSGRSYRVAEVVDTGREVRRCRRITLADGTVVVASEEHPWLTRAVYRRVRNTEHGDKGGAWKTTNLAWRLTSDLRVGEVLSRFLPTWETGTSFDDGYISGFLDGEGHVKPVATDLSIGQKENAAWHRMLGILGDHGFDFKVYYQQRNSGAYAGKDYSLWSARVSGRATVFHALGRYRPARLLDNILPRLDGIGKLYTVVDVPIVAIEDIEHEVVTLETSTGTYFAEGFAAHNSGKTAINGGIAAYLLFERAPSGSEMYVFANSQDQSVGRVFAAVKYAAERNQALREACEAIQGTSIRLRTGSFLAAQAAMNANVAGANPYASYWTELWGYQLDNELRTWDEMTPPPTVVNSIRVVDTYAGYEGESTLLNGIEDRLRAGRRLYQDGYMLPAEYLSLAEGQIRRDPSLARFLMPDSQDGDTLYYNTPLPCYVDDVGRSYGYWDEGEDARRMPWQQGELGRRYYAEQERTLMPGAFRRFHLNLRAKRGGQFVPMASWDMLPQSDPWQPGDRRPVVLGLDAAVKRDHMALVGVRMRGAMPEQCYSREWEPTADARAGGASVIDPAAALAELKRLKAAGMRIASVAYDPYQLASVALQAAADGFNMREFNQGPPRLLADTSLRDRIVTGALAHTHDPVLRAAVESADAREQGIRAGEGGRWRIVKGTGKVDSLVALSMAVHEATGGAATASKVAPLPVGLTAGDMIASGPVDDWSRWDPGKDDDLGSMYVGG